MAAGWSVCWLGIWVVFFPADDFHGTYDFFTARKYYMACNWLRYCTGRGLGDGGGSGGHWS